MLIDGDLYVTELDDDDIISIHKSTDFKGITL